MMRLYILLGVSVFLGFTHWQAYRSGKAACEETHRAAVAAQATDDASRVVGIVKSDVQREVRYVEKRIVVEKTVDDCLDRPMPAAILDVLRLQHGDSSAAPPRPH
jgi:hypothetical protein